MEKPVEKKVEEKPKEAPKKKEDLRYIVRITNKDLDGTKNVYRALQSIKGISHRMAQMIAYAFQKETGTDSTLKLGSVNDEQQQKLEQIVSDPQKFGIPLWTLNRQKDFTTGNNEHLIMGDLDFRMRTDLQRLMEIKSYRGLRRSWGLPVRGQRNKGCHRRKGSVVGVKRKDTK